MAAPGALRGPFRGAIESPKSPESFEEALVAAWLGNDAALESPKSPESFEEALVAAWLGNDAAFGINSGLRFEQVDALGRAYFTKPESPTAPRDIHFKPGMNPLDLLNAFRDALFRGDSTAGAIIRGVQGATEDYCADVKLSVYRGLREIMRVAFSGGAGHCPLPRADRKKLRQHIGSVALGTVPKLVK